MYICICKAVTRRELLAAIDNGARTVRELRQECNVANCCGKCAPDVGGVLAERLTEAQGQPIELGTSYPVPC